MGIEDNKALVERLLAAISAGRLQDAFDTLAEDATWWVGGKTALSGTYTKPQFMDLLGGIAPQAPTGLQLTPLAMTAEGERVAVEVTTVREARTRFASMPELVKEKMNSTTMAGTTHLSRR